jgi:hypothetical protein
MSDLRSEKLSHRTKGSTTSWLAAVRGKIRGNKLETMYKQAGKTGARQITQVLSS